MIANLNIVTKTFAKIAKTFVGLSTTITATRKRLGLQKVNFGQSQRSMHGQVNGGQHKQDDVSVDWVLTG